MEIQKEIKVFIIKILTLSIILTLISAVLFLTVLKTFYFRSFPLQLLIIASLTAFGHIRLIKACELNMRKFATVFMLSVTMKLIVYLSFLLIGLLIDHSNAMTFVLTFFILYVCYTVFEVIEALKFLKK